MMVRHLLTLLLIATPCISLSAEIDEPKMSRGELLYRNHCIECHNQQIHWREARIAKDTIGIKQQVTRWQDAIGVQWTEEEINDVTRYLNRTYYLY
jgi:cytochrome c-type biogenesis protein CcmH/NrfF